MHYLQAIAVAVFARGVFGKNCTMEKDRLVNCYWTSCSGGTGRIGAYDNGMMLVSSTYNVRLSKLCQPKYSSRKISEECCATYGNGCFIGSSDLWCYGTDCSKPE